MSSPWIPGTQFSFPMFSLCCMEWVPDMWVVTKSKNMIMGFYVKASIINVLFIPKLLLSSFYDHYSSFASLEADRYIFSMGNWTLWSINRHVKYYKTDLTTTGPTGPLLPATWYSNKEIHTFTTCFNPSKRPRKNACSPQCSAFISILLLH